MKLTFPFVLVLILGCSSAGRQDEQVDALIEDLVIAPSREALEALKPAEIADRNDRASKALDRLNLVGWRAFPQLVAYSDDQRIGLNLRVRHLPPLGITCFDILEVQVIPEMSPSCWFTYSFLDWSLVREWWRERSGLALREVQIEAALFALALARNDHDRCAESFAQRVKELGVADPESAMLPFRRAFAELSLPDTQDDLIATFKLPQGNYLQRRIALERSSRAWDKLQKMGLAAFPALLRHLDDPATGDQCFRLIQRSLLDAYHEDHPELTLLSKSTVASWLKERSGRTLKELRIEIVHHCIDTAKRTTYKNKEEKDGLLEFLNEHLDRIQKE